ncbi:MAG: hypothetical protein Q7V88_01215 [Actinomycetota bacterium]|nr:hypothetical protein [Actinomycetota bacterium]
MKSAIGCRPSSFTLARSRRADIPAAVRHCFLLRLDGSADGSPGTEHLVVTLTFLVSEIVVMEIAYVGSLENKSQQRGAARYWLV